MKDMKHSFTNDKNKHFSSTRRLQCGSREEISPRWVCVCLSSAAPHVYIRRQAVVDREKVGIWLERPPGGHATPLPLNLHRA